MRHDHPPTTISLELKLVHRVSFADAFTQQSEESLIKICYDFTAGEAPHWDDHDACENLLSVNEDRAPGELVKPENCSESSLVRELSVSRASYRG